MKKVIMYKYYNPDRLYGGYGWSVDEVWDDWNHIYSDPYYVEIPDDFELKNTIYGEKAYFKKGCNYVYELTIGRNDFENGNPYLIGGNPTEKIKLKVLGIVPKN